MFRAIDRVGGFNLDFISVTYGAGGSTRDFTERITMQVKQETGLEVMTHLTCVAQTRDEVQGVLERLDEAGVENVIALAATRPGARKTLSPPREVSSTPPS